MEATPPTPPEDQGTFLDQMMADGSSDVPRGFPLNKLVAFAGPYIAIVSGVVANWLLLHVHILATFHLTQTGTAGVIAQLLIFGLTAGLVWLGHQKWLTGWQKYESDLRLPMVAEAYKALNEMQHPNPIFDPAAAAAELKRRIEAGEIPPPPQPGPMTPPVPPADRPVD